MSAIDDLKNGVFIDTTTGQDSQSGLNTTRPTAGVVIDSTNSDSNNVVDLSNLGRSNNRNRHTFVAPSNKEKRRTTVTPQQVSVSDHRTRQPIEIDAMGLQENKDDDDIKESIEKEILDINNPKSPFAKYLVEITDEANDWIAQREDEAALKKEDEELDLEEVPDTDEQTTKSSSLVSDFEENKPINTNALQREDDEDLSSIFSDNKEDITNMDNTINMLDKVDAPVEDEMITEDEVMTDEDIDEDDVPELDNDQKTSIGEDAEDEVTAPAQNNTQVKDEKKERFDAPDMDIQESNSQSFVTDIEEDSDDDQVVETNDDTETLKKLQKLATEKLKPISKKLDISSFTVLKKPVTNIKPIFEAQKAKVIKWVLPNQESIVLMKEFSGSEIEKLREYTENSRSIDMLNRRFHMIYDHIVSAKPATFEQWLKTTPYEDVDHYFFAIYVACFKGANYLPADCPNNRCGETFLSDDISIMDMVKFETEDAKKKFATIYQNENAVAGKGIYCTEVVPITNDFAIAFRDPSIYNVFEISGLDDRTRTNHAATLEYIPYIDTIYTIDMKNATLTPITYKMYPDNANRTTRSKIQKYESIFNSINIDAFGTIKAYIRAIQEKKQDMYYVYPEIGCPKCGTTTKETRTTAEELVFTRYQLGSLVSTSLS